MVLELLTTAWLTLPKCLPLAGVCDTFNIVCDSTGAHCDTLHACSIEDELATAEVWWWARWAPEARLLRTKQIAGMEGQVDTLDLPSNEVATVYIILTDSSGNRGCQSNWITVNGTTGVVPPGDELQAVWLDIAGRIYFTKPERSGIYWEVRGRGPQKTKRVVILR